MQATSYNPCLNLNNDPFSTGTASVFLIQGQQELPITISKIYLPYGRIQFTAHRAVNRERKNLGDIKIDWIELKKMENMEVIYQ